MLVVKEIVRTVFDEIKGSFKYSHVEAGLINKKMKKNATKAIQVPYLAYWAKKGTSLQYSMAMIYRLKQNNIKAYLGIYKGEGLYSDEVKDDYAFVIYRDGFLKWYIADLEPQDPQDKISDPTRIKVRKFEKVKKSKLWIYDPYDERQGRKPLFDGFFEKPKWIIR